MFWSVSMKYCSMSIEETSLMCIVIWQRLTDFWIKKNDILRLFECLQLAESTVCCQKSRFDRIVALYMLLKRFSYPYRCKDMVPLFSRNPSELRMISTLDFIYQRYHHRLEPWTLFFYNSQIYRDMHYITVLTLLIEQLHVIWRPKKNK